MFTAFFAMSPSFCFNEAGSVRSRKQGAGGEQAARPPPCFNEAGSVRSRKPRAGDPYGDVTPDRLQ